MSENIESEKVEVKITESPDHIIGIISSGRMHDLEDNIMGVVNSKIREKVEVYKQQVKIMAGIKE